MTSLNKFSLFLFLIAKVCGIVGVGFGFAGKQYHEVGGYILSLAVFSIFLSIFLSLIQSFKDKKNFAIEDEEVKQIKELKKRKNDLELQILKLKEEKKAVENFVLSKNKIL